MFAAIPAMWASATGWLSRNPIVVWIGAVLLFLIGWEKIKHDIKQAAKKAERDAIAVKQAEVARQQAAHQHEVISQERSNADQALQARDSSRHYPTFDSLPDAQKRVLDRRPRGNSGS